MDKPILVLGGGQLGLMMAEAASHLGISLDRIDTNTDELIPGTSGFRLSQSVDELSVDELLTRYPVVTAEMEHLPDTELVRCLRQSESWVNGRAFKILPSRSSQKQLLDDIGVANAPWCLLDSRAAIDDAHRRLGTSLIVKTTRGGYDGKGQWVIENGISDEIPCSAFGQLIAEKKIDFSREISLVGARANDGSTFYFPLSENYHHKGILRYSLAPAHDPLDLQSRAEQMLQKIMDELDYVGVMTMECFESEGEIMVNELAPRVHNSGHWTQTGSHCSQFDLHVRALSGIPFPEKLSYQQTLMLNLIGCEYISRWNSFDGIHCYWYGKERRENRKLGHINIVRCSDKNMEERSAQLRPLLDSEHQAMLDKGVNLFRMQS